MLMQLRKVCNHPNLFEVRPTVSPFQMEGINFVTASLVWSALDYDPFKVSIRRVFSLLFFFFSEKKFYSFKFHIPARRLILSESLLGRFRGDAFGIRGAQI